MRSACTTAAALSAPSTSGRQQATHAAVAPCRLRPRQQPFLGEASALRQATGSSGRRQQRAAAVNVAEQQQAPAPPKKQQGAGPKVVKASAAAAACRCLVELLCLSLVAVLCLCVDSWSTICSGRHCNSCSLFIQAAHPAHDCVPQVPPERVRNFSIIAHIDHGGFDRLSHVVLLRCLVTYTAAAAGRQSQRPQAGCALRPHISAGLTCAAAFPPPMQASPPWRTSC